MNLVVPDSAYKWIKLHRTHISPTEYGDDVKADFFRIEPWLPDRVESIVDIGCGMAGIDVFLKERYPDAKLYLLDGDGDEKNFRGGFDDEMQPFNSKSATEEFLTSNGVDEFEWIDAGIKEQIKADLVVSLLSWGFHYPLDVYNVTGLCVADLRTDQYKTKGDLIWQTPKFRRCIWRQ